MYTNETPEYLYTMFNKATRRRLTGTIGDIAFTGKDVIAGSFEVTNRCSSESDMKIGGVYIGELTMTFAPSFLNKLARKKYIGKQITPYIGLFVPDNDEWEDIPLGVYTVQAADISKNGISVDALDNMVKFDKPFPYEELIGTAYNMLKIICQECGVDLGITRNFVEDLPNGEDELYLDERNDIETYRDLIYWIAQTTATFATIDREGRLVLRKFGLGTTEFDETNRDVDAVYSDFVTKWTEVSFNDYDTGKVEYYSILPNDGLTMELGANPLLQTVADGDTQAAIDYLEMQIHSYESEKGRAENIKHDLEEELEEVEEELREHPDDPELLARKAYLEAEIAVQDDNIMQLDKRIEEAEKDIEDLRQGLIDRSKVFKKKARRNVLREVAKIRFTPFSVISARDPIFDLGDKIVFTGGMSGGETGCIMAFTYTLGSYTFEGYGGNPELATARSKTDKSVTGNKKAEEKDYPIDFSYAINVDSITIRKEQESLLGLLSFGLEKETDVETWVELKVKTTPSADRKKGFRLTYYLDNEEVTAYHPVEEWEDLGIRTDFTLEGNTLVFSSFPTEPEDNIHTINFHYHLTNVSQGALHTWRVTATGTEGVEIVDPECCHIVVWAEGLKGEKDWEGLFKANDSIPVYPLMGMPLFGSIIESVATYITGETETIVTESGDPLITEDGDILITD